MKQYRFIIRTLLVFLLLAGVANQAWAIKAYYHILTLPINTTSDETNIYHLNGAFNGYRLEALRVMVDGAQDVELPAAYKSPLAKNFRYYYAGANVTKVDAVAMYAFSDKNKSFRYQIVNVADSVREKQAITSTKDVHIYVTYEYDASKGIKLDGTENYNIPMSGGFLALNRGRNNRLAVISETSGLVSAEDLVSEDFVKVVPYNVSGDKIPGTNITTYFKGENTREEVAGQFYFLFKFEGSDPYNILIGTAYNKDDTYIESHAGETIVYKWYQGAHLFRPTGDGNFFLASDDHKQYTQEATKVAGKYPKPNPTDVTHDDTKTGYFHNKGGDLTYNTFALLNSNSESGGYVFMVSRFIDGNGDLSNPSDYKSAKYNFLIRDGNYNNLTYSSMTLSSASSSYSTDKKIYPIRDVNFKVKTPFYALASTDLEKAAHIVTAAAQLSQYTIDNDKINSNFIPDELKRKYCTFTTFRNSAGTVITKYTDAYNSTTGEYDVYVDYSVQNPLFTAITPKSSYTEAELNAASWYELTDDGSTEESGKKLQVYYDDVNSVYKIKNNGASGTFNKTTEYAFIGDPYELRVILRSTTTNTASPLGPHYVGAATASDGTAFTVGASDDGAGYKWEIPDDATAGSFRLRVFSNNNSGADYWSWDTGNESIGVTYDGTTVAGPTLTNNPQTITLNVTGLTYAPENYLIVEETTDPSSGQVGTITIGDISSAGAATITVAIAANSSSSKSFTLTITEKDKNGSTVRTATAVTFTQGTTAYTGGNVQYNTTATRVKVLTLPTRTYTYKIVDKSGRIAVKASINQTIFMPLSTTVSQTLETCLPPNIVSPYLVGETLAFYDTYTDGNGRTTLAGHEITETPNSDNDIFVTYTTSALAPKPINLSEDQEFNVMLNGQYIYYDATDKSIKSTIDLDKNSKNFFWKLRNHDPYHMLIDNMGARIDMGVSGDESVTVYNDDGSEVTPTPTRQKGVWVISGIPASVAAGSTTYVNLSKDAIASISIDVSGLTDGSSLSVNTSDNNLLSISVSPTTVTATGTATITASLAANETGSSVRSTITLTESGSGSTITKIVLIQDKKGLGFTTSRLSAQQFIAKASLQGGIYEVMVADGGSVDASTTYYDIGRTSSTDINIYDNSTYAHGDPVLAFVLQQSVYYQYHLIDLAKHKLLTLPSQTPDLVLPAEYQSPLVGLENYNYYASDQISIDDKDTPSESDDEYTPKDPAVKLSALTDLDAVSDAATPVTSDYATWNVAGENYKKTANDLDDMKSQAKQLTETGVFYFKVGNSEPYTYKKVTVTRAFRGLNIYVTYKANDRVTFNDKASPYMLKFLNPYADGYYLEDGNDKLIPYVDPASDPKEGRVQAVYPYCNGDGSLNIYSEKMQKEQFNGGAATRPRWIWFFESENKDPYHVMIHSNNTISFNSVSHPTYLQTFAVNFVQGTKHIVTCGTLPTVGSEDITEYMVLGTDGQFRLRTTNLIDGARRDVKSLEQYWKTYNMIKLHVLGIDPKTNPNYKDEFSNDESTWVVPEELRDDLETRLAELHIGTGEWHSYAIYANATRWNGYNDKTDGHEKKCVQKLEHWFQTFEMGDGSFDIESASIPPVLVLLDRHGWEIMRKPLPNISTYPEGGELDSLKVYDSPMVKEYKFYSNATKASGCHKYSLRMQNGAERDQIMDGGKHYTSTSLGSLPPIYATGVESNGVLNDQYVTYTVKEEYEDSYTYNFVDHGNGSFTESGTASKFLMVQNGRFYKKRNDDSKNSSYFSKPIFEHTTPEGGNVYDLIVAPHANNNIDIVTDGKISDNCLWYVGPNLNIDKEMGIKYATTAGGTGEPLTEYETKKNYFETGKGGFDPYNIQLKNAGTNKFMTSAMTKTELKEGAMKGTYTTTRITLEPEDTSYPDPLLSTGSEGYDHTNIAMTNQTFMAVSDANGNMQLMPRFDHDRRVNVPTTAPSGDPWPTTLENSVDYAGEAKVDDNSKMGPQTTFFVRPQRFVYRIIDNDGNEALRYKRAGDYYPTITEHFMSPLATDFKFYFDHAAYTSSVSTEESYTAAATSGYFKKTATSEEDMATIAKALTFLDDYYFKVTAEKYNYVKVTVTTAHSGSTDAVYTATSCSKSDYDSAIGGMKVDSPVADDAALETAAKALTSTGDFYYRINTYNYKKVTVTEGYVAGSPATDATFATADCTETDWTNAEVKSRPEVADLAKFQTAVDNLTVTGTHFYKIGPYEKDEKSTFIYKKVVVKSGKSDFLDDVYNKRDISAKEITGQALAEFDFVDDECTVYVRYSYNASADQDGDKILQGKWFTVKLDDKDVVASGTITPPSVKSFTRIVENAAAYSTAKLALSSQPDGEYYFRIGTGPSYTYKKVTVTSGVPDVGTDSSEDAWNNALDLGVWLFEGAESRSGTAANSTEYETKRDALNQTGDYYFRIGTDSYTYNKVEVTAVSPSLTYIESLNGDYATQWSNSKPLVVDTDAKKWQWKFLMAPIDPSSELHETPDPYAIKLFNRYSNNAADPTAQPSPMATPIKVNGKDRFSLLSHPSGGYALAVNGLGSTDSYDFLNGAEMTTPDAGTPQTATTATEVNYQRTVANYESASFNPATYFSELPDGDYYFRIYDSNKNASYKKFTVREHSPSPADGEASTEEAWNAAYHFTIKSSALSPGTQLVLNNDVTHNYEYRVINNGGSDYVVDNPGYLAVTATQDNAAASSNNYAPYLPESAQTPLLRNKDDEYEGDYLYYGSATVNNNSTPDDSSDDTYAVVENTKLFTLHGLYDDVVYVRYKKYDMDKTPFKVPNEKAIVDGHVAKGPGSHDAAMNISGGLPYNIFWYNDNIMSTSTEESPAITSETDHALSGDHKYVWYFEGGDPYALKIRHKESSNYVNGTSTLVANAASAMQFMLLKKSGYDYGILQQTGNTNKLNFTDVDSDPSTPNTCSMTDGDPTKFIIFGLSVHDLIYRLVIATTNTTVKIPYRTGDESTYQTSGTWTESNTLDITGTTQRDLTSKKDDLDSNPEGSKYQLGETIAWGTPSTDHIYCYDAGTVSVGDVLEVPSAFYRPNCTFEFYIQDIYGSDKTTVQTDLNNKYKGLKLKNLMSDAALIDKTVIVNIVYSFDQSLKTNAGMDFVRNTDQNLWYTFETQEASVPQLARYTNTQKLTSIAGRETRYTNDYLFTPVGDVYGFKMYNRYVLKNGNETKNKDESKVMTTTSLGAGQVLDIATPVAGGYEVYELLTGNNDGYFRVHPVVDIDDGDPVTPYNPVYVNIADNKLKLSTTPRDWTYGLDIAMLQPYYLGAGNVGGLTTTIKTGSGKPKSGKALYEDAVATGKITEIQNVVYDDKNIVDFTDGYYRLHSQPGISGISPVRYASGYLHEIEKTAGDESTPIPMHFYSKSGVNGTFNGDLNPLKSGYTQTNATRGDIPVPSTETDPSTIFRVVNSGESIANRTISRVVMSTQGLNVIGNTMGTADATPYRLIDIGGGIVVLVNTESGTRYLNFIQATTPTSTIYDLKFSDADASRMDDVKWCMEPANNKGLLVAVNNGGDDYYYSTFCAPYDVKLPDDNGTKTYYAYICDKWDEKNLHPKKVPAVGETYAEGKFVPAGTPVIFRIKDESGSVKLTIEGNTPSAPLSSSSNIFSGKYLEQLLPLDDGDEGDEWTSDVYTLGLPFISDVHKDGDYDKTGDVVAPLPEQGTSGLGFYINATSNKEHNASKARWDKNNRYVIHNKIYYRAGSSGASAHEQNMEAPQFVPIIFDDEEGGEEQELQPDGSRQAIIGDGCIYDLSGRKVATEQQVQDGSWRTTLASGIYILNGRKFQKK